MGCGSPVIAFLLMAVAGAGGPVQPTRPFAKRGAPEGWLVRAWDDVSRPAPADARWEVDEHGVLHGSEPRGTWLMSEREYADFVLDLDFKIPARGNSGVALRAPLHGDPAYDGMELQIVDPRYYNGQGEPAQLCGAIYRGVPPKENAFRPEAWNHYHIICRGSHISVVLNGKTIQDLDVNDQDKPLHRDSPEKSAPPLKDRPRKGHIGFQELSRDGHVQIRNVALLVLDH